MDKLIFPDLKDRAEKSRTIEELWTGYIADLRAMQDRDIRYGLYANKLMECFEIRQKESLINEEICSIRIFLEDWAKMHGVDFEFQKRIKDFVGLNEKIRLYLSKGRMVDEILDLIGFRIIIKTPLPEEQNIAFCYELMNEFIKYVILGKGYLPMRAEPLLDLGSYPEGIKIPSETRLEPTFSPWVKDYIRYPKKNGYQSLHIAFKNPHNGWIFETQIRTASMNERAERGPATHNIHKKNRYLGYQIEIDPGKLKLKGFIYKNGKIIDKIGLMKSKFL